MNDELGICGTPFLWKEREINRGVYTKGFKFDKEIAEIHETKTYSVNLSLQTEIYSGRQYVVFAKIKDGVVFRKLTIPVGLAHSIAYFLEETSKIHGDRTPRPIHIDDLTE